MTNYRVKSDTIPSRKERKETPSCGQSKGETKARYTIVLTESGDC